MILKNIDVLKEIIKLGKEITLLRETKDNEKINKENLYKSRKKQEDLAKYLDNRKIKYKEIMTIMYIGIDKDYDIDDSPNEIFNMEKMFLDSQGWPEKEILIYTISNKSLLDEFLIDGLKALNIEV